MPSQRTVINVQTGEVVVIDRTPEEEAKELEWQQRDAAERAAVPAPTVREKLASLGLTIEDLKAELAK